jgi:hypothetical protein
MELPDDVLCLVREYSRPLFKYTFEYKQYVRMHRKEWPELKKVLSGPNAEHVVATMVACMNAISLAQEAHKQYQYVPDKPDFVSRCAEYDRIAQIIKVQQIVRDIHYMSLQQLVQGG